MRRGDADTESVLNGPPADGETGGSCGGEIGFAEKAGWLSCCATSTCSSAMAWKRAGCIDRVSAMGQRRRTSSLSRTAGVSCHVAWCVQAQRGDEVEIGVLTFGQLRRRRTKTIALGAQVVVEGVSAANDRCARRARDLSAAARASRLFADKMHRQVSRVRASVFGTLVWEIWRRQVREKASLICLLAEAQRQPVRPSGAHHSAIIAGAVVVTGLVRMPNRMMKIGTNAATRAWLPVELEVLSSA